MENDFLPSIMERFLSYKELAEKAIAQISDAQCFERNANSINSIAMIIHHMSGNMLSRWTHFLTEDGEKSWRQRDQEFEDFSCSRQELLDMWNKGWDCLINALSELSFQDLDKEVYIRTQPLKVYDAITRQIMHYSYHVGQIVLLAKIISADNWKPLSIAKNESASYNQKMGL